MRYREIPPPSGLGDLLDCLWIGGVATGDPPSTSHVMPDGCMDIIWEVGAAPIIAGPDTRPAPARVEPGTFMVAARFLPGRAPGLLGVPASDLRDLRLPLEQAWGSRAVRALVDSDARDPGAMLRLLTGAVEGRLATCRPLDPLVGAVVDWARQREPPRFSELCRRMDASERHLRRRVEEHVGYGAVTLRRVLRFQRLLRLRGSGLPLVQRALEAGYADQAHMTREVGRLAGVSPSVLLARTPGTGSGR